MTRRIFALFFLIIGLLMVLPTAQADVSVTGGFTGFSGVVGDGDPNSVQNFLNNQLICPAGGCSTGVNGFATTTFAMTPAVDFFVKELAFNGQKDEVVEDIHNLVQFTPAPAVNVGLGTEFKLGTFTLANGIWTGNRADFAFQLTSVSSDPALDGFTFDGVVRMQITQNTGTPQQNGDMFSLISSSDGLAILPGPVFVYELSDSPVGTNIGTVDLYGRIDSLVPTRLANPTGGAYFYQPVSAPEPSALVLLGSGLLMVFRKKRNRT